MATFHTYTDAEIEEAPEGIADSMQEWNRLAEIVNDQEASAERLRYVAENALQYWGDQIDLIAG